MGLLVCVLWLVAAVALADRSPRPWVQGVAAVLAGIAGTTLPDLDLLLPIGHRSGLTHSLLPLALALFATRWRPVMAGLAIGIGLHLAADSFPNAMRGYATVKLPGTGSIGAAASYVWLGVQAVVASVAGAVLLAASLPLRIAVPAAAALAAIGAAYLFATDGGWPALGIYAAFGWLTVRHRAT
ncbi:hypothetical protein QLH51_16645 [Sphingomonas sp. 2R-10]|uniref:hypothetical protein n=1 Tax=Sphingomonas sp. 2R-10 TaxID=3045148 RepID=UPI000F77A1C8|nr:hypothetical protein [Sphingomonas sp. 2R-10]MDJ0278428.1 hypothetical protein [Sphingomonas sp. 2R-10]